MIYMPDDNINLFEKGYDIVTGLLFAVGMAIVRFCLAPGKGLKDGIKTAVGCVVAGVVATMLFQYTAWPPVFQFCTAALVGGFGKEIFNVLLVALPATLRSGIRVWMQQFLDSKPKDENNTSNGNRDIDA